MKASSEYKNLAIKSLEGNWLTAAIATLIYLFLYTGVSCIWGLLDPAPAFDPTTVDFSDIVHIIFPINNIATIVLLPVCYGYALVFLNTSRGKSIEIGELLSGFKQYARVFLTLLLKNIYIILWSLLLFVPGIIKAYSYSMTEFVMADNPNLSYDEAIKESMRLMQGRKFNLFFLDLTFIGWGILCLLTLGLGFLFLNPYISTAHAHFYQDILAEEGTADGDYVEA